MSQEQSNFHEKALNSVLFKGHSDWYFCYLKAEKIAHVLFVLAGKTNDPAPLQELAEKAAAIPEHIAYFAAAQIDAAALLADLMALLPALRLSVTRGSISHANAAVLVYEYEQIIEKISGGLQLSPFISSEDLSVPRIVSQERIVSSSLPDFGPTIPIKDNSKGHQVKDASNTTKVKNSRMSDILQLVRKDKSLSIKDISRVIRDCSEKTIQRELAELIRQGLVRKVGERRWSVYVPTEA